LALLKATGGRQCPLVLLIKVGRRGRKTFGCEEGRDERWSKEIICAVFHCTQLQHRLQTLNLGKATYGEILIFIWGGY
jgi:hypothetical protein